MYPSVRPAVFPAAYPALGGVRGGDPVITGTAYPAETLTSTRAGQWYADGVAISGETANTYVVRLGDIGKAITQTGSNTLTIWHPHDIAGVARFWSSLSNIYNTISPDVAATDAQAVRRWNGLISGTQANQATGVNQPLYRATGQSGNPSLQFDGSNDLLSVTGTLEAFKNKSTGYVIIGCRDTNHTAGASVHVPVDIRDGSGTRDRIVILTRDTGNVFVVKSSPVDGVAPTVTSTVASNANYNVITAECFWTSGVLNMRINGAQAGTANFPSNVPTSNTNSVSNEIGSIGVAVATCAFPGHVTCVCFVNALLSSTDRSRLERYIGLFGNLNIPLV